jgi:hypothetical protein
VTTTPKMKPLSKNQADALHLLCDDEGRRTPMRIIVRGGPPHRLVGLGIHIIPDMTFDALARRGLAELVASGLDEAVEDVSEGIALSRLSRQALAAATYGRVPAPTEAGRALHASFTECP